MVPTGNFGDILAGYYAKLLGLPVKHLVVASDKNNVLFDFLTSGTYNRQRPFYPDDFPVDGYSHFLEPGAHAVLHVRQGHSSDLPC